MGETTAAAAAAPQPPEAGPPQPARALPRVPQSRALVGSFDALDHGYEAGGWVCDMSQPDRVCAVELRLDGTPIAQVQANLPRPDLAPFRIRTDCGFRITVPASAFDGVLRSVEVWVLPEALRVGPPRPLAAVIRDHKPYPKEFSVDSILRLEDAAPDYDRIFPGAFLQRHGVRAAVAYAYLWLLKRPPDRSGWDHYSERILSGEIGTGTFLRELAASEEAARARRAGIDLLAEFEAVLAAASRLPPTPPERPGGGGG
jgi:hypothetical protein